MHAVQVSNLLQAAVYRDPTDMAAWIALAQAQIAQGRLDIALNCYERALALDPEREDALIGAAALSQNLHRASAALDYWRRAVALNPWMPLYRANLMPLMIDAGKWDEVQTHAEAWLSLDPESAAPRQLHITLLLRARDHAGARAEFARIERLRPPNLEALRAWFADQTR
jgi:tetratricopeptide (TPR) repeat protein